MDIFSQNLADIGKSKAISLSGSLGMNLNVYSTTRDSPSRDPFFWTFSGSPVLSVYGVTLPFSIVISQKQQDFRQPFNQFGLSPYYKWATFHLGYRSMNFSQYSLNGHMFYGVGTELTPGKLRFGVMYGRLLKPIPENLLSPYAVQPTYLRKGFSAKIGYGSGQDYIDLVLFKGWDDKSSITRPLDSAAVNPEENLVLSVIAKKLFFDKLLLNIDYGISGWTNNLFAGGIPREDIPLSGVISNLMELNYSSQMLTAGQASLSYNLENFFLKAQYERIDPDYKSMGAYFFNSDLENITLSPGMSLLNKKMRIMTSFGVQRNNLNQNRASQTNRKISSLMTSYAPNQKLNFNVSYTNYQMNQYFYNTVRRDVLDSLGLENFSTNLSFNSGYNFGDKVKRNSLYFNTSYQSTFQSGSIITDNRNDSYSLAPMLSFRHLNNEKGYGVNTSISYNNYASGSLGVTNWSLNLGGNKKLSDSKLNINTTLSFNQAIIDDQKAGNTFRISTGMNYNPGENHSINIRLNVINRKSFNTRVSDFIEVLGTINYNYRF